MNRLLLLAVGICLFGCVYSTGIQPFAQGNDIALWEHCPDEAQKYFETVGTTDYSKLLACASSWIDSSVREKCETANSLSSQSETFKNYYSCLVDLKKKASGMCVSDSTCGEENDKCQDTKDSNGATVSKNTYAKQTDYDNMYKDLQLGTTSTKCPDIASKCSSIANATWKDVCIRVQQQYCYNTQLRDNYSDDPCINSYICEWDSASFGMLAKFSLVALLVLFAF